MSGRPHARLSGSASKPRHADARPHHEAAHVDRGAVGLRADALVCTAGAGRTRMPTRHARGHLVGLRPSSSAGLARSARARWPGRHHGLRSRSAVLILSRSSKQQTAPRGPLPLPCVKSNDIRTKHKTALSPPNSSGFTPPLTPGHSSSTPNDTSP